MRARDIYPAWKPADMKAKIRELGLEAIAFRSPKGGEYYVGATMFTNFYVAHARPEFGIWSSPRVILAPTHVAERVYAMGA